MRGENEPRVTGKRRKPVLAGEIEEHYRSLTSILNRFIGPSSLDDAIKGSLKDMCKLFEADNGMLYLQPGDENSFGERYEWCQEKVRTQMRLTMLPHEVLSAWLGDLARERVICIEDVQSASPGTTGYHEHLPATGMKSLLVISLEPEGKPDGLLTLVTTSEKKAWTKESISGMRNLAHALAQAVERKRGEQIMRNVDKVRAVVLDSVSELVTLMDPDMKILWGNRAAAESLGMAPQQLIGRHCYELWNERDEVCVGCPVKASVESGCSQKGEVITPDGRMWQLNGYPVRNSAGDIVGVAEVTSDVTEVKRTAVELRKSEEKFRTLVENSLQGLAVVQDYRLVFANAALAEISGYPVEELLSLRPSQVQALVHPDDQGTVWGRFRERIQGKAVDSRYTFRISRKDGSVIWVEMFATLIEYMGKPSVQATIIDITSRKQLDEKMKQEQDEHSMAELIS
jgi:PAS domain S-box-containing protein